MSNIVLLPLVVSIPAFVVIGYTIFDAMRRPDLPAMRKLVWTVVAVVIPVVGSFLYLLSRPLRDPGHTSARGNQRTSELIELLVGREGGDVGDDEFVRAKHAIFLGAEIRS